MEQEFDALDLAYEFVENEESAALQSGESPRSFPSLSTMHSSAADALVACINAVGWVDLEWMAACSGNSAESLISQLAGTAIVQDPSLQSGDYQPLRGWYLMPAYFSGNLKEKLEIAKKANEEYPGAFQFNVNKLQELLPERVSLREVHVSLGAPWVPADIYTGFIEELLEGFYYQPVSYDPYANVWDVSCDGSSVSFIANQYTYGTERLSALQIIKQTMNAKTVKVFDDKIVADEDGSYKEKKVLNKEETLAAQDKQKLILEAFEEYVFSDVRRIERLENKYNDEFAGYLSIPYDGSFLKLPGLNPEISLYDHQKSAVARILLSENNVLLAHEVGTGKTFEMVAAAHELHRMGLSEKNMIVTPNNVLQDVIAAHHLLYPEDSILEVTPKAFTAPKRKETMEAIAKGDYTACYIAYSSFDRIRMSKSYWIEQMEEEIMDMKAAMENCTRKERNRLKRKVEALSEKLVKFRSEEPELEYPGFDELGISTLFVDEAHNYKNIPLQYKADNIVGMHNRGSSKAKEMLEKSRYVDRLVFATGTPLTNSIADLFVLQTYLQHDALKQHSIDCFDQWINTFAQRETNFEIDIDASGLRAMTRFSVFHNLSELMSLFSEVCDFHFADEMKTMLPDFEGYTDVTLEQTRGQKAYLKKLSARTEKIRETGLGRKHDNLLSITTDGRKAALDIRLVGKPVAKADLPLTKISACAREARRIYEEQPGCAQLIFSDLGTPGATFCVYDELRRCLEALGIPGNEIAYIHDAQTEAARTKLFNAVNKGKIRIIIGSTPKLGLGVNVQERLAALHHLSVPWRPADMVQREGRILRQGNTCSQVQIFRYITKGTFDAYSWQLLENKQRFISSFLSGTARKRSMDDIADSVLSYADVKALAIGNPLIKKRVETSNRLERQKKIFGQRQKQLSNLKIEIEQLPVDIEAAKDRRDRMQKDASFMEKSKARKTQKQRIDAGQRLIRAIRTTFRWIDTRAITYRGFEVMIPAFTQASAGVDSAEIYLRSPNKIRYNLEIGLTKPLGAIMSIEYLTSHLADRVKKEEEKIMRLEQNLVNARNDLNSGNPYAGSIQKLQEQLDAIDLRIEEEEAARRAKEEKA